MKYKLINIKTKETHLCDKVSIDGFDYYVSKSDIGIKYYFEVDGQIFQCLTSQESDDLAVSNNYPKVIATNNPSIDCPKVVDEVEIKRNSILQSDEGLYSMIDKLSFKVGYNKSQETNTFSEEDMIEFADFVEESNYDSDGFTQNLTTKELLQLWKEQKTKTIYFK